VIGGALRRPRAPSSVTFPAGLPVRPRTSASRPALALLLLFSLALCACTTLQPLDPAAPGESLSGRLALRVDAWGSEPARAFSAAFDLRGSADDGVLSLSTPLGSTLGQARWRPGVVTLATPQGTRRYADLQTMTREVLGESVPVDAWFDWLRGRPWPGATSAPSASGFAQLGWDDDTSGRTDGAVVAVRASPTPAVTVRSRLDTAG